MNNELFPELTKPAGQTVKAWCCGKEMDCILKVFSNGTKHAWGTCPICGKTNCKKQNLSPSLEELKHRLMWIESMIFQMPDGIDRDEAICMVERCSKKLSEEMLKNER